MTPLEELRAPFAGVDELHFNNAGVAPMTARAERALADVAARMRHGSTAVNGLINSYEEARGVFATLVGAQQQNTAFFQTCAAAISQVAYGLTLSRDDEIVIVDQEYPSNHYPWLHSGGTVVNVTSSPDYGIDVDRVLSAITPKTHVIAVSWVQFQTGTAVALRTLADAIHAQDGWLVVDAIQGLGVIPFDLEASGADAVCGGTHKWLLGPLGHGFLALAEHRLKCLRPLMHGAMTYGTPDDPVTPLRTARNDPRRFEPGTPLLMGAVAGAASIELLLEIGIDVVQREALAIADLIRAKAEQRGLRVLSPSPARGAPRSPITTIVPKSAEPKALAAALGARGCAVAARGGGVRIAPHAHNGSHHVEALFKLWDELDR